MIRSFVLFALLASAAPGGPPRGKPGGGAHADLAQKTASLKPGRRPGMRLAGQALKLGSYRTAIKLYERQVAQNPDAAAPNVALGRAYGKAGRCGKALDQLEPWVGTEPFGEAVALMASTCATRLGLREDALYYDLVALEAKPTSVRALTVYALDLDAYGDTVSRDEVIETLAGRVGNRADYVEAVLAVRHGDSELFDFLVQNRERQGESTNEYKSFDARLWLDLGDPQAALVRVSGLHNRTQLRPLRAEATRRLGDPTGARQIIDAKVRGQSQGELADAIRIRVLDDLGELDDAAALVEEWADADDSDLVASRWYHARATGDAAAQADAAAAYAVVQESALRTLDALVPLGVPPSAP